MTKINVKMISENDVLSPVGGKKVGEKIIAEKDSRPIVLDFHDSGSHTSLFFNAMLNMLKDAPEININQDIQVVNETPLDVDTYQRSKNHFLSKLGRA